MRLKAKCAVLAFTTVAACSQPPLEHQILDDALVALGGQENVATVESLSIEAVGVMGNLGQDLTPEATTQSFAISDYRREVDLATGDMWTMQTRTPDFDYFRGPASMDQVLGIAGDVAYNVGPNGEANRANDAAASDRRVAYYHHPLTLLKAAQAPGAVMTNGRTVDGESLVDIKTVDGSDFTLAIDEVTKLPISVTSRVNNNNLRDTWLRTRFADYEDVGGLVLPETLTEFVDDFQLVELSVTAQEINGDVGDLTAPNSAASAVAISGPPPASVDSEEIAAGVWFLTGQGYNSVLIEFSDHTMLVEAPNEVRTLALIAAAQNLVPDKPLTQVVNTHHHFDHSAGIRAAISAGLSIITHVDNAEFYRQLADRASSVTSDALSMNPRAATVEEVGDQLTHEDDTRTVELYHVAGSAHSASMLMVYLPQDRLLIEADAFSPGRTLQRFAPNLLENIQRLELNVDLILPVHGGIATFSELLAAVQAMENN